MIDGRAWPLRLPRRTAEESLASGRRAWLWVALAAALALAITGLSLALALGSTGRTQASAARVVSSRHGLDGQATWAAGVRPAPRIDRLPDQSGRIFSLASLRGHTVAVVFFDSHCHQECPLEGRALAAAERPLPRGQRPVLVAVSVNPLDTPASARHAVRAWGLAGLAPWHWLMASRARLSPVWSAFHVYVGRPVNGDIPHTEAVYLVDRHGYERSAYLYPFESRFVAHDLRVLARGRQT